MNEITIRELLESYNANTLKEMAEAAGIATTYSQTKRAMKKADLIDQMDAKFFLPDFIKERFDKMDKVERQLLNAVRLQDNQMKTNTLKRKLLRLGLVTEAVEPEPEKRNYGYRSYRRTHKGRPIPGDVFENVVARLTQKGLLFSLHDYRTRQKTSAYKHDYHPKATFLFIPTFVLDALPPAELMSRKRLEWVPERIEQGNPQLFLRNLYLYWATVRRNPIKLLKTRSVGKKDMKLINGNLLTADPSVDKATREDYTILLYFLRRFLEREKLLHNDHHVLEARTNDFWQKPTDVQLKGLVETWNTTHDYGSLGKESRALVPIYRRARNTLVHKVLPKLEKDVWYGVEDIYEALLGVNQDFLFARTQTESSSYNYVSIWISELGETLSGTASKLLEQFEMYERLWIESAITQIGAWGIVDVGYKEDKVGGIRINDVGDALFKKKKIEGGDGDTGNVIVQPSFQILAMGGVPISTLAKLDDVAERVKVDVNAFEYQLTRDSVYRAQELGMDAPQVKAFLTEINGSSLPQNIGRSLDEWAAKHERIVFRTDMTLLQTADSDLLNRLINDDKIGKSLARPLMDDVALVHPKQMKTLTRTLTKEGLLPVVTDARPESADHSINISDDGTITPIHAVPSLHLRGRLAQIAVAQPGNRWQLTEETIRKAGTGKAKVTKTLAELTKLQVGALSDELELLVKRWGGYYGRVAAETITLVQFQDHDTLKELSQHPDLHGLLTPFPLSNKPLATVEQSQLTDVQTILARIGATIDTQLN